MALIDASHFDATTAYAAVDRHRLRIVKVWPLSDYAPRAQYLAGRCLEAKGKDQMAFDAYQKIIEQYPKSAEYEDVLWRQYEIADRFLHGEWPRLWGYIPYPPSMDLPANMFGEIVTNGPYSDVAPHAQLRIGAARERQKDYPAAVAAYETAADRYQGLLLRGGRFYFFHQFGNGPGSGDFTGFYHHRPVAGITAVV